MESYLFQLTNFNNVPSSQNGHGKIQRIFDEVSSLEDPMSLTNMIKYAATKKGRCFPNLQMLDESFLKPSSKDVSIFKDDFHHFKSRRYSKNIHHSDPLIKFGGLLLLMAEIRITS